MRIRLNNSLGHPRFCPKLVQVTPTVSDLLEQLKARVGSTPLRGVSLVWVAGLLVAGVVARWGTLAARAGALSLLVAVTVFALVWPWWRRKREQDERRVLSLLLADAPHDLAKVRRSYDLQASVGEGVSPELARLHYSRQLQKLGSAPVTRRGEVIRRRWNAVTVAALAVCALVLFRGAYPVVEGYDVLMARGRFAPWPMRWLEHSTLRAKAPAYLGNRQAQVMWESAAGLPEGSVLSIRGAPVREGLSLVITDGETDVPFVEDGEGALVAHWELRSSSELRVAARFGDVLIPESRSIQVHALPDQIPKVLLADAPREMSLKEISQIEIQWRAADDHQVSQVDLVLRSGGKEERRTLDRPSPGMKQAAGGHLLYPDDPFISQSFLPVVVRVEARDNHAQREREIWGKSEAFILKPAGVGEAEVSRFQALTQLRDALTDIVADYQPLSTEEPPAASRAAATKAAAALRTKETLKRLELLATNARRTLADTYAGLEVTRGMAAFLQGQLDTVVREFKKTRSNDDKRRSAIEAALLAVDAGLVSLAHRDARHVSKALGDVADEAAFAARRVQEGEDVAPGAKERLELAIGVLAEGARGLRRLGTLGNDLGLVAEGDLGRVIRSKDADDFFHAELAALHLAARLHRPNPSFGSKGGGGGGSVESGNGGEGGEPSDKASDADEAFDRLAHDLAELSQEHADAVERTASALDAANGSARSDDLADEAKRRAQALRRSVISLPEPGEAPSTSRASSALSREHAGAMAHDLENLDFEGAVESGRRGKAAAEEALRRGDLDGWTSQAQQRALDELKQQLDWATRQRDEWRQRQEQAAKEALLDVAKSEQELRERARRLAQENSGQAQLPEQTRQKLSSAEELMRQAAQHLSTGRGQVGLNLQRQAQRLLEESQPGQTTEPPARQAGRNPGTRNSGFGGAVPAEDRKRQAEEFRRRVLEGLARGDDGKLSPAVKRYAEGLLR